MISRASALPTGMTVVQLPIVPKFRRRFHARNQQISNREIKGRDHDSQGVTNRESVDAFAVVIGHLRPL